MGEYPFGPDWNGRFDQRFCAFSTVPIPFTPQKYVDFLAVIERQFHNGGEKLNPIAIMDSVNDSHKSLKMIFEEIRNYSTILSGNGGASEKVYTLMNPEDIIPTRNSTKLLRTNVMGSLSSLRVQKVLTNMPKELCAIRVTTENTTSSDSYMKYFKFPLANLEVE